MSSPTIHVIFRACDKVHSVNKNPRPFDLDKTTLVKISFMSLMDSLAGIPHSVRVLGDAISDDLRGFFSSYNVELIEGVFGNDASIRKTFELAFDVPDNDWVYFCEDDYIHVPHAMPFIYRFINASQRFMEFKPRYYTWSSFVNVRDRDLVIHPTDYPDRYKGNYRRFSLIFHSDDCHWRQITDTTFTFLLKGSTLRKHYSFLKLCSFKANDRLLSRRLFGRLSFIAQTLALSPMPGLATHMHKDTMAPLVDWESLVQSLCARIRPQSSSQGIDD